MTDAERRKLIHHMGVECALVDASTPSFTALYNALAVAEKALWRDAIERAAEVVLARGAEIHSGQYGALDPNKTAGALRALRRE